MTTSPAAGIFLAGTSRYAVAGQTILALLITMAKIDERDPRAIWPMCWSNPFWSNPRATSCTTFSPGSVRRPRELSVRVAHKPEPPSIITESLTTAAAIPLGGIDPWLREHRVA